MLERRRFDVVVVGAGPGGIAAASAAARAGRTVGLVDDNPDVGGQIWRGGVGRRTDPAAVARIKILTASGTEILAGTQVVACDGPHVLIAERDDSPLRIEADSFVLATGARELFLPFPGWTLPNVTGAGGLQAMVKSGLPIAGRRVVVAGSGPLLLAVAAYLKEKGAVVVRVAEQAPFASVARFGLGLWRSPAKLGQAVGLRRSLGSIPVSFGWWPRRAEGDGKLSAVVLTDGRNERSVPCDHLACGFGLVPNVELPLLLGCEVGAGGVIADERCATTVAGVYAVGEALGIGGLDSALVEGEIAGLAAAGREVSRLHPVRRRARRFAADLDRAFALRDEIKYLAEPDTIVCRCEDATFGQVRRHEDMLSAKLQTRCGMGPCQGRICGPALEFALGWARGSVRPPVIACGLLTLAESDGPTS